MRTDWNHLEGILQQTLDQATSSGEENCCQLAIYHQGRLVLSFVSGAGVDRESLFPVFSCSKAPVATLAHILVQKGYLSYDTRICDLWPEFGCHGKEEICLWHLLSHRAGLSKLPVASFASPKLLDWQEMCRLLAEAAPMIPNADSLPQNEELRRAVLALPAVGGAQIYHPMTFGWLVGETLQRATGKSFRDLMRQEILEPLGIENTMAYGSNEELDRRFIPVDSSRFPAPDWNARFMNDTRFRHACIPAATGVMTAEAMARHFAALVGEVDGVRLLSPETVEYATRFWRDSRDPLFAPERWYKFGLGYVLGGTSEDWGAIFGHAGACGSEAFAVKREQVAIGFTKNKSLPEHPNHKIRDMIADILELPRRHW